jgi:hypothetical protein
MALIVEIHEHHARTVEPASRREFSSARADSSLS